MRVRWIYSVGVAMWVEKSFWGCFKYREIMEGEELCAWRGLGRMFQMDMKGQGTCGRGVLVRMSGYKAVSK
jgi:hypothetical protein